MGVAGGIYGKVEGLNKTLTALQRFGVEAADLKSVMGDIAAEGARLAGQYAPVRKGNLRRTVRGNKAKAKAVVIAGRARVPYAGAINYGWPARGIRPALFMQRADAELAPKAVQMLEEGLDRVIKETGLDK